MIEKLKKNTKDKIRKMKLGDLVREMHEQLVMLNSELDRADKASCSSRELYVETRKRKENIQKRYDPIIEALQDEMNLYHISQRFYSQ